jgi:4-amino-4-deoxy-L-arabinose transferase-like glycosyltransferase
MRVELFNRLSVTGLSTRAQRLSRTNTFQIAAISAVILLAAVLRLANLEALGYANHYYAAAVESMLKSWHNFFFVAAEPGGAVSVDKPPLGLWIQTISAAIFGVNTFGLLLPEIAAGILSVAVVYHLVRRSFGTVAGLLAALVLAITPVTIATDRNNTIDSLLILTLLLAAWAFIKATEGRKRRFLLLGAILVGLAFNIKMLEAFLPLPAFYALYLLGSSERLRNKLLNLALASVVLLLVALSWATVVELTPADQRPYVGSSGTNSVYNLIVGYNGVERLMGMGGRNNLFGGGTMGGGMVGGFGARDGGAQNFQPGTPPANTRPDGNAGNRGPRDDGAGQPNGQAPNNPGQPNGQGPAGGPGGQQPGNFNPGGQNSGTLSTAREVLRLFLTPLSKEVSWLLPFGLFSILFLLFGARLRWPLGRKHRAVVLWGGWLITCLVFFTIAGFYHEYYLSIMGPPLAALVGIGAVRLWRLGKRQPWWAFALLSVAALSTLALQVNTINAYIQDAWWLPLVIALLVIGIVIYVAATLIRRWRRSLAVGFACILAALLVSPAIWSGYTTAYASDNQSLPAAYSGRASGPGNAGQPQVNQVLLSFLQANTQGMKYLMAVPSSMQGADYVLATGRPVLYMGGFMGQDKVLTSETLAALVKNGDLRYVYEGGRGGGLNGGQADVSEWITNNCKIVEGFDTTTRNSGAPDGTNAGQSDGGTGSFGGDMQVSLYDCAP